MFHLRRTLPQLKSTFHGHVARRYSSNRNSDPLRILYCGSDEFSAVSLRAVHEEHRRQPEVIKSIDLVCRPDKRVGRGLKKIRQVPIKKVAAELQLPIHEIDTFTGWHPPRPHNEPINLIIAVSFGLFVPPRILQGAKYGGLNVHPSLLPEFRGAAPLQYTLLAGRTKTGITLQTLHPEQIDHGTILAQTPPIDIPDPDTCTVQQLSEFLAPKGAELLIQSIQDRLFMLSDQKDDRAGDNQKEAQHTWAPKIRSEDSHINWQSWTTGKILRRQRVLGPLWNVASSRTKPDYMGEETITLKRIIMQDIEVASPPGVSLLQPGIPFLRKGDPERTVFVRACDGNILEIPQIKVEGRQLMKAATAAEKDNLFETKSEAAGMPVMRFCAVLQ